MAINKLKPRANTLTPNKNISFPIGSILAIKQYYKKLGFQSIFRKFKSRGIDLNSLIEGLLSYKLTENLSIVKASEWMNRKEVLEAFGIRGFEQKTLYRVLSILGENREEIMMDLQDRLFETYDFEHTNINMDWTSIVLHGEKCPIAKFRYSRDHRPDKKQITIGVSELASPINVPIGMTVREGNVNDQVHFTDTFNQVIERLSEGSLVVFDQGANRKANLDRIEVRNMKYITARQLNKSDDATWIKSFDKSKAELLDHRNGVYGLKKKFPSRINYLCFSEKLHHEHMESKLRKVDRLFNEAELIQKSHEKNRRLPKRYRINNPLIDCEY